MQQANAVVIGAGPAGLAATACLKRAGIEVITLEKADRVGHSWTRHYERLHLHTARQHSELPFHGFPRGTSKYPSRLQVVAYLESYAEALGIEPRFGEQVERAWRDEGAWHVSTGSGEIVSKFVVVATGYNGEPNLPELDGLNSFAGRVVHSSDYHTGAEFLGQRVLVVGCGNSGAEVAIDLYEQGADPSIVVRGPAHVLPRDLLGQPILATAIAMSFLPPRVADTLSAPLVNAVIGDLSPYGIVKPAMGPIEMVVKEGRIPILDIGLVALIKAGRVTVRPGVASVGARDVAFADGRTEAYDAIVLATGFRSNLHGFLDCVDEVTDDRGYPRAHGTESSVPGLFFLGFRNPPTGMLREINRESRRIASEISARS